MHYQVIVNEGAGLVRAKGRAAVETLLNEHLQAHRTRFHFASGAAVDGAFAEAIGHRPDILVVIGGDGTCRAAAGHVFEKKIPLALLPAGTMNMCQKKHWGETCEIAEVLGHLGGERFKICQQDVGFAGEYIFLVAAAFGVVPELAALRERMRGQGLLGYWHAARRAFAMGPRLFASSVRYRRESARLRGTTSLIVSLGSADQMVPGRDIEEHKRQFECVAAHMAGWSDLLGLLAEAGLSRLWRKDARVESFWTKTLTVQRGRKGRHRVWATIDGEPAFLPGPVHLRYGRDALSVVTRLE